MLTISVVDAYTTSTFFTESEIAMVGHRGVGGSVLGSELVDWRRLGDVINAKLLLLQLQLLGLR